MFTPAQLTTKKSKFDRYRGQFESSLVVSVMFNSHRSASSSALIENRDGSKYALNSNTAHTNVRHSQWLVSNVFLAIDTNVISIPMALLIHWASPVIRRTLIACDMNKCKEYDDRLISIVIMSAVTAIDAVGFQALQFLSSSIFQSGKTAFLDLLLNGSTLLQNSIQIV